MERYEQEFRRNHNRRQNESRNDDDIWRDSDSRQNRDRNSGGNHKLQNYESRYQNRGNYYGMPDPDHEYRNVRTSEGSNFGRSSSGPVGGYGASNYHGNSSDRNNRNDSGQRSSQSRSSRDNDHESNHNYGSGSRQSDNNSEQYRYGDPNPYMNNDRNGGYERTRGTGWRSESDNYEGTSYGQNRYDRQENSYTTGGEGRRYSSFGRDEEDNYGHNMRDRLDHGHTDRGDHSRSRHDNDYSPKRQYGSSDSDRNSRQWKNVSDKYSQNRNQGIFDHTDNDYPATSRHDRHRSGPDWSADSAASDYSQSDLRG